MSKKKTGKVLAVALCATTMAAFYATPVMAGNDFIASNNASVGVTDNAEITLNINGQRVGEVTNVDGVVKMDVKGKYVGEGLEIKPVDANGSFKVANIAGNTMIYTMDGTSDVPSFMVNAANGNIESVGSMKIANGLLEVSKEGNAVTAGGVHMQEGALEASTIIAGNDNFEVTADGSLRNEVPNGDGSYNRLLHNGNGTLISAGDNTLTVDKERVTIRKGQDAYTMIEGGNITASGTINGATITAESFNGVNIGELANSVEGIDKVSANVAGITRPRGNETIIEGKVAINSVGNVYTPGSIIAENGFSTGNGNFAVSGATGDITTKGAINGVSLSESGIKFGNAQILASKAGDVIINGNTIGFDGINATGGLSVGVLDKKFAVDADGNIESQGTLSVANGAFSVKEDGSIASQFAADGALVANKDGFAVAKGANSVNVNEYGVGIAAGADNQVSVTKDGIGLQAGTSQVIMNSKNGIVFRNGDKAANGETVINGGNITATGTINGATITDKAFNGVEIYDGKVDGVDVSELKGSFDKANENVAGITRPRENETIIEGKVAINSVGNVYTPGSIIAENGFSTGNGNFAVSGATGDITTKGAINGVSLSESGIKFGNAQILASKAGDVIINGNTIGFDGINATGGLSVGVLDKKFAVDADGNIESQGTLSVANGAFKVDAQGNIIAGTYNGATITDKAFNGVEIYDGKVDGVDVSELKGSFDKANENVAGITRKDGNTNIEGVLTVSANGLNAVKDNSAIDLNKDGAFLTSNGNMVFANANAAGLMADENNFISVSKNGIGLKGNVVFDSKYGSVSLGSFYEEYKTNVGRYDEAIKDLQDKTQNINKDKTEEGHTQIDGDLTVGDVNAGSGNINAGNVNAGTVNADNVVVGDTTINKDGITSNKVTVGETTIDKDGITSNKVTVGETTVSKDGVTVGGKDGTTVSKDGVTVGGENGTSVSKDDVVINKGTDKEVSLSDVGNRVDNLEQGLADANRRIDRVDEKIDKVGAMAAAIANLRTMGYDPEAPTEIAVGVGQYRSETGAALGFFHYPNRDFMLSMSVSTSGDEVMGGIGATWKFGRKTPAEMKAAKERAAEKAKLEKAAAIKKAAELAKVEKQQQRHAELAAKKAAK